MIVSTISPKPCCASCITATEVSSSSTGSAPAGHQPRWLQFLAPQAHQQQFAAKIRI
jgi:hypothetical protein